MTLAIIQARLGSSRLPNKSLMELAGRPLIEHVIERAKQIAGVRFVVLAVPYRDVSAFRFGNWTVMGFHDVADDDVLGRFAKVLQRYPSADTIMRLTGDCPLLDPVIAGEVLALYHRSIGCDYASNVAPGYVDGEDVEVFSASLLKWTNKEATEAYDREHVTPWIRRHAKIATLLPTIDRGTLKTSVDTLDDLLRVRTLVEG